MFTIPFHNIRTYLFPDNPGVDRGLKIVRSQQVPVTGSVYSFPHALTNLVKPIEAAGLSEGSR